LQAQGSESRFLVIARLRARHWSAVITYRQQAIRLISFRLISICLISVRRPRLDQRRVNVELRLWMVEQLDLETSRRVSGAWVLRDRRIPVAALFENLKDGVSLAEFVELFLGATPVQPRSKHGWCWSTPPETRLELRIRQVTDRIQATIALIETGGYQELANP